MVAETATLRRIDIELKSLLPMLGDRPDVVEEWEQLPDAEQASWSLDWDQVMGGLKVILEPAYRNGSMTPDQRRCYPALLHDLKQALPIIERLHLRPPSVRLEA